MHEQGRAGQGRAEHRTPARVTSGLRSKRKRDDGPRSCLVCLSRGGGAGRGVAGSGVAWRGGAGRGCRGRVVGALVAGTGRAGLGPAMMGVGVYQFPDCLPGPV